MSLNPVLTPDDVLQALRIWHENGTDRWPLARLRLNSEITTDEAEAHSGLTGSEMAARNRVILGRGLNVLAKISPRGHDILRERFEFQRKSQSVAHRLNVSHSTFQYHQKRAIDKLTEIIVDLESMVSNHWQSRMLARLNTPSYERLIGVQEQRAQLTAILTAESTGSIIAIDGIGGIGKTAMADQIMRDLIQHTYFDDFAWVTAKQTHLSAMGRLQIETGRPALTAVMLLEALAAQFGTDSDDNLRLSRQENTQRYLRDCICLVVVDNLETVADYRSLLPEIKKWGTKSKFLLTSRHRLLDEHGIYSLSLKEMAAPAAFELMRTEAVRIGFRDLAEVDDEILGKIYAGIGGNPLALKLVVAQLRVHTLDHVLAWFTGTESPGSEALFEYIYSEIWESLSDKNKHILMSLTWTAGRNPNLEHLVEVTGLAEGTVVQGLTELVSLSLVEPAGTFAERRYRLHRLTTSFLSKRFGHHGA